MTSKAFTLTLVRHGQTTHNKLSIIQGQMESQLTELGKNQAKLLNKYLEETNEKFDKVYSSDLIRAYETCQIVCNGQYEIVKNQLLRERAFGVLQGLPLDLLRTEAYKAGYTEKNFTQFRPEGGETMEEVLNRVRKFCVEELFPNAKNSESIMIVTHGGVIREFMKLFNEDFGCQIAGKDLRISPNTGMNKFEIKLDSTNKVEQILMNALHTIPHLSSNAESEALSEEQLNDASAKDAKVEHAV